MISAYAPVPDIRLKVSPILLGQPKRSHLVYVNLAHPLGASSASHSPATSELERTTTTTKPTSGAAKQQLFRLGGSALLQTLGQIGDQAPNIDHPELLRDGFELVQQLIREGVCTAGHDVSDGGLIVCAIEMALASHCGLHLNIGAERAFSSLGSAHIDQLEEQIVAALFAEECAVLIELSAGTEQQLNELLHRFELKNIQAQRIGFGSYENQRISVKFEQQSLLEHDNNGQLRAYWENTSRQLELRQANRKCVEQEYEGMSARPSRPHWRLSFDANATKVVLDFDQHYLGELAKVAVLREEGINGDREMQASLASAGFEVFDLTVTDLSARGQRADLNQFQGLVFPGGFSYADVFGSGRGWAASLVFNERLREQLVRFRRRPNTFSLGVCNGCQLMSLLGFLDELQPERGDNRLFSLPESSVRLEHNQSGRFECRFVNVRIETATNSLMLRDMEDSVLGVWVAHGEGKFVVEQSVEADSETRVAMRYVDDLGEPTMDYPLNPNGSDQAVAAMCSRDGRHLAMMPHPERCTQMWQWPYEPLEAWRTPAGQQVRTSPWMRMFVNAYEFCQHSA